MCPRALGHLSCRELSRMGAEWGQREPCGRQGHCAEVECADWNPILQALQYGVAGAGGTAGAEVSSSCATWSPLMQRFSNGWSI